MDECEEFKAGFCVKTEFFSENKTEICPYKHLLSTNECPPHVLTLYNKLILEVEKKIIDNEYFLQIKKSVYLKMEKIEELKKLILENKNFQIQKKLIKALGLCIKEIEKNEDVKIGVCNICAAFVVPNEECKHVFHNKYKMLRMIRDKLSK